MASGRHQGRPSDLAEGEMERILMGAAHLLVESGYAGTSVQAIVDAAGASKPMVYYYFGSKRGLYGELVNEAYRRIRQRLEEIDSDTGDIESRLVAVVEANFDLYRESPHLAQFSLIPLVAPRKDAPSPDAEELGTVNFRLAQRIVEDGLQRGEIEGSSGEITLSLMGLITIYVLAQVRRPGIPIAGDRTARRLVRQMLNGLRPR